MPLSCVVNAAAADTCALSTLDSEESLVDVRRRSGRSSGFRGV